MEINKENFAEAIKSDEFKNELKPLILGSETIKQVVENKADLLYKEKIDDEVRNLHSQYDNDIYEILGEKPGEKDGKKQKTYDKVKELLSDLKTLRSQKDSLTKDAEVQRLNAELEKARSEGGAKHVQEVFDQAKSQWSQEKTDLLNQIEAASENGINFKKQSEIQKAIAQIKFNPDTPESVRKLVTKQAETDLLNRSKIEGDKFIVLNAEGKPALNSEFSPQSAYEAIMSLDAIKDISLKADNRRPGGGADPKITGSIQTTSVEGKDTKKLILDKGTFKSKLEFNEVATKALMDSGISKSDKDFTALMDQAYKDNGVGDLPTT